MLNEHNYTIGKLIKQYLLRRANGEERGAEGAFEILIPTPGREFMERLTLLPGFNLVNRVDGSRDVLVVQLFGVDVA